MYLPKVVIVDDDADMLQLLAMRVESMGYQTHCFDHPQTALDNIQTLRPDVLMTDLRMDDMTGLELFEKLHQHWPTLPVIVVTAHGSIREAVDATQKGVFAFLTKPIDKHELASTLQNALKASAEVPHNLPTWAQKFNTQNAKMLQLLDQAKLLANNDVNILISGESGSGKELLARALHQHSARHNKLFMAINCSAIPGELLESELFGHRKGAFTGANRDHQGLFVATEGGVLFLDEVGDMPLTLQAKLLRVLQEKVVRPLGATQDVAINVRVISATHRNLVDAMQQQQFREDLYYRLNVINLQLPSLRERKDDIPLLVAHFLRLISERTTCKPKHLAPKALKCLMAYDWPGNIRQLENVIEQVVALSPSDLISVTLVEKAIPQLTQAPITNLTDAKKEFERHYVQNLLQATQGRFAEAAKLAGRNRSDFYKIAQRHGLEPDKSKFDPKATD